MRRSKVAVIVVGIGDWEKYTQPFLESLDISNPGAKVVCVDNGSPEPYPAHKDIYRLEQKVCLSAALNYGIDQAGKRDWYCLFNNDVLVHKPFIKRVETLDSQSIYGFKMFDFHEEPYLCLWGWFLPGVIWDKVGRFDEALVPMWFEDADYSIRARNHGFKLAEIDRQEWGLQHFEDENMAERKQYMGAHMDARVRNRAYVRAKHGLE